MSLIHWWPLNGNLKDYGILNRTLTNINSTAINNNGKIGKCYYFNGSNNALRAEYPNTTKPTNALSLAGWYKAVSTSSDHYIINCYETGGAGLAGASGSIKFQIYSSGAYSSATASVPDTNWHHWCGTFDGRYIKLYMDGVLKQTTDLGSAGRTITYHSTTCWMMGANPYNDSPAGNYTNGYINDVRMYDHALSLKEIKEISKGLVLHYNFENACNPNLFINSGNYTVRNKAVSNLSRADGYKSWPIYFNGLVSGATYTLSVDFDGTLSSSHKTDGSANPNDKLCSVWLYFRTNPFSDSDYSSYDNPVIFTSVNRNHKQISPTRHQWTFTLGTDLTYYACCAIRTNTYSDGSTPVVVNFWNFKLEKSDTSTPFVSNTASVSKIYDDSGNGYNGTISGNLQILGNSPSGNRCAKFDSDVYIDIPTLPIFYNVTYSFWVKIPSATTAYRSIFIPKNNPTGSGIWLSVNCEGNGLWAYQGGNSPNYCKLGSNLTANTWYLCTHVVNNGVATWYLNGQQVSGSTTYTTRTYVASANYTLGDSYTGSTWSGTPFDGNIADFKIYATALSAADILAEYNRKASIDRDGNLYTGEFVETDGAVTSVDKQDIVNTNVLTTTMTLDDGSVWVPICVHYVPDGLNSGNSNKYIYTSKNIWNCFGMINDLARPESGYYEFYVMQQTAINGAFSWFRFKQNINPFSATWADVNPSKVGTNVTRISASTTNGYAGMYWMNTSNIAMCFANGSNGNWFGCGARANWHSGTNDVPGYNGQAVLGWQIVYMRITKTCAKMFKNGLVVANNIIEN